MVWTEVWDVFAVAELQARVRQEATALFNMINQVGWVGTEGKDGRKCGRCGGATALPLLARHCSTCPPPPLPHPRKANKELSGAFLPCSII